MPKKNGFGLLFRNIDRDEAIKKLAELRQQHERPDESLIDAEVSVGLLLSDVCDALGLDEADRLAVLGGELVKEIEVWQDTPVGEVTEKGRAWFEGLASAGAAD